MNLPPLNGYKPTVFPKALITDDQLTLTDLRKARVVIHLKDDPRVIEGPAVRRFVLKGDKLTIETDGFTFPENAESLRIVSNRGTFFVALNLDNFPRNVPSPKLTFTQKLA